MRRVYDTYIELKLIVVYESIKHIEKFLVVKVELDYLIYGAVNHKLRMQYLNVGFLGRLLMGKKKFKEKFLSEVYAGIEYHRLHLFTRTEAM